MNEQKQFALDIQGPGTKYPIILFRQKEGSKIAQLALREGGQ